MFCGAPMHMKSFQNNVHGTAYTTLAPTIGRCMHAQCECECFKDRIFTTLLIDLFKHIFYSKYILYTRKYGLVQKQGLVRLGSLISRMELVDPLQTHGYGKWSADSPPSASVSLQNDSKSMQGADEASRIARIVVMAGGVHPQVLLVSKVAKLIERAMAHATAMVAAVAAAARMRKHVAARHSRVFPMDPINCFTRFLFKTPKPLYEIC